MESQTDGVFAAPTFLLLHRLHLNTNCSKCLRNTVIYLAGIFENTPGLVKATWSREATNSIISIHQDYLVIPGSVVSVHVKVVFFFACYLDNRVFDSMEWYIKKSKYWHTRRLQQNSIYYTRQLCLAIHFLVNHAISRYNLKQKT